MSERTLLTGWGRTAPSGAIVRRVDTPERVVRLLHDRHDRGVIARGLARSYGDAAQNAGGEVIDTTGLHRLIELDLEHGRVTAGAGMSLDGLLRDIVPLGWFVPVTPGTRFVTLGGAFAADVHGKNHHVDGSFAQHVDAVRLVTGVGDTIEITPDSDPEAFWATAGGMGLTGVVTELTLRLRPIETSRMVVDTERTRDLDHTLERIQAIDDRAQYTVAWIDGLAAGGIGRGVLTSGRHAGLDELPLADRAEPLAFGPRPLVRTRFTLPRGTLSRAAATVLNEVWYRRAPRRRRGQLQSIGRFFHPLDAVADWNRAYGPDGLVQYQFVVPTDAVDTLRRCLERVVTARVPSFLGVLKRFGPGTPGPLSFPTTGWTVALDFPGTPPLRRVLDELDDAVAAAGGRVYLAKDARLRPEHVPVMYPRLEAWRAVRDRLDPERRLTSDLARRLDL